MIKRASWFVGGVVTGAAGLSVGKRKLSRRVKRTAAAPINVVRQAAGKVRGRGRVVVDAVREGRDAMREREAELRDRLGDRPSSVEPIDGRLEPGDVLYVDGRPVSSDRVVVVKQTTKRSRRPGRHLRRRQP